MSETSILHSGRIERYDDVRGFGFIRAARPHLTGGKLIFFHVSVLDEDCPDPAQGLAVSFRLTQTPKGLKATHVEAA